MVLKVLKSKNGYRLLKYPTGFYGVDFSTSGRGEGILYLDDYKKAVKLFNRVVEDSGLSSEELSNQREKKYFISHLGKKFVKDKDKLRVGDCTCVIRNKHSGSIRYAKGSVSLIPYNKEATKKLKQKHGKNLVYVLYRDYEEIKGYYQ